MRCVTLVMAKAPVAGYAKTRLIRALGAEGAAALAECLLARMVDQALAAALGPVRVLGAPDASHPAFQRLARWPGVQLDVQGEGDLGQRMARALGGALRASGRALLTGTDVPALDAGVLRAAAAALDRHPVVLVPALDGGYALVGLRVDDPAVLTRWLPALFDGMPWSQPGLMQRSRERLAGLGLAHAELPALADIDEPADLVHLPAGWRPGRAA